MKIKSAKIDGFGTLSRGGEFNFSPGFNLIYGSNEAGKSTLMNFLVAMLFGMKEEGLKRRSWTAEHSIYKPWNGTEYGGKLILEDDENGLFALRRKFGEDEDEVKVFDEITGREITDDYGFDKTREINFSRRHLGLTRTQFISTACIRQLGSAVAEDGAKSVAAYARSLVDNGQPDSQVEKAGKILLAQIDSVGKTERGKIFKKLKDSRDELKKQIEENINKKEKLTALRVEYKVAWSRIKDIQERMKKYRAFLLEEWINRAEKKLQRVKDLESENTRLESIITRFEELDKYNFDKKDRIIRLQSDIENLDEKMEESDRQIEKRNKVLEEIRSDIARMKEFEKVSEEELSQFSLLETRWHDAREELKVKERELKSREITDGESTQKLTTLSAIFSQLPKHIDQIYLKLEGELTSITNELENEVTRTELVKSLVRNIIMGIVFLAVIPVSTLGSLFILREFMNGIVLYLAGGVSLLATGAVILLADKLRKTIKKHKALKVELKAKQEETAEIEKRINNILEAAGCEKGDDFIALYNTYQQSTSKKEWARKEQIIEDIERLKLNVKDYQNQMLILLDKAFPGIRPDKISREVAEKYVKEGRKYLELSEKEFELSARVGEIEQIKKQIEKKKTQLKTEMSNILKEGGVDNYDEYMETAENYNAFKDAREVVKRNSEEIAGILHDTSVEEIEKDISEWRGERRAEGEQKKIPEKSKDIEKEIEGLREEESALENRLGMLKGQMTQLESETEDRDILESKLANIQAELKGYRKYRDSLMTALNTIDYVSSRMHRDLAPRLTKMAAEYISTITSGKYQSIKVDEELNVAIESEDAGMPVKLESLSYGARDQVYLALRIALTQLFSGNGESIPIILDDSLTQYDDERALNALRALNMIKNDNQVLMFTCHDRDRDNFLNNLDGNETGWLIEL